MSATIVGAKQGGTGVAADSLAAAVGAVVIPSVAIASTEIDWAVAGTRYKVLGASDTFTFANAADGQIVNVAITNTGAFVPTFPGSIVWAGGSAPTPTAGKTDFYTFIKIGSTVYGAARLNF